MKECVTSLSEYFDWLLPLFTVLRNAMPSYLGEDGQQINKLEVDRMLCALKQVRIEVKAADLVSLA